MSLLDRAERRFGRLAIPGLIRLVVGLSVAVFILYKLNPHTLDFWYLDPELVMQGEVWRLVSYIFIPQFGGIFGDYITLLCYVLFQVWVGDGLEQAWGAFRLNVYFLLGMIGVTIAAFFFGASFANGMLFNSLFFAFARYYGDMVIHLFFILPVKVKWLAWFDAVFLVFYLFVGSMEMRAAILFSFINYFLFFGKDLVREARLRRQVGQRRALFVRETRPEPGETMHRCRTCGRTETSDPSLEFRVAADGEEYCFDHLPSRQAR